MDQTIPFILIDFLIALIGKPDSNIGVLTFYKLVRVVIPLWIIILEKDENVNCMLKKRIFNYFVTIKVTLVNSQLTSE